MKLSYRWLQDYVKTNLSAEELADRFRMTSSEVEGITDWRLMLQNIVVGKVEKLIPHPNADRLRVATVNVGAKPLTIVCGGTNLELGQTVLVALPGARLYPVKGEPFTIEKATVRNVASEGMICAASEIGITIPEKPKEIWVLEEAHKPGTAASTALGFDDTVLDLEITPNRPDLLSYLGLAREVATFDKRSLTEPAILALEKNNAAHKRIEITIEDSHSCHRYSGVCFENVSVVPSPWWLQARLLLAGMRPVNCIVDITNYVMLEFGQPMHAFDLAKLPTGSHKHPHLTVRSARKGEKVALLDETVRNLEPGDIVITNAHDEVIDLAGIMGGEDSGISETTTQVFLESANFDGPAIRRTSRRLGLRSEASGRFEKGLDPELSITALKRAAYLFQEICGATVSSPILDHYTPSKHPRGRIHVGFDRVQQILGVHISPHEAKSILQKLGFQVPLTTKSSMEAVPPSWRADVTMPEDIMEELVRIWGYERIPSTLPTGVIKAPQPNISFERKHKLRTLCAASGFYECVHIPFLSEASLVKTGFELNSAVRLPNPLSLEMAYLAPSHLPAFLENISGPNLAVEEVGLFEIGKLFQVPAGEQETFSSILRGNGDIERLYARAKGMLSTLSRYLGLPELTFVPTDGVSYLASGTAQTVYLGETRVGTIGVVNPDVVAKFKIRRAPNLVFIELQTDFLMEQNPARKPYKALPMFPGIERDITLILSNDVPVAKVTDLLDTHQDGTILTDARVKDVYRGKPLNPDQKAITIHFSYNGRTRTLEDSEVSKDQERLAKLFRTELQATIND